jgi:hypothetical protein
MGDVLSPLVTIHVRPRVLRWERPVYACGHVAVRQELQQLSRCGRPATHAVRADPEWEGGDDGVVPLCLKHANRSAKDGLARVEGKPAHGGDEP